MKTLYQCDVCEVIYCNKEIALLCQQHIPPKPELTTITILTRYDGDKQAEVERWVLRNDLGHAFAAYTKLDSRVLDLLHKGTGDGRPPYKEQMHKWCAQVAEEYQIGKEWWSNVIPLCNIKELS